MRITEIITGGGHKEEFGEIVEATRIFIVSEVPVLPGAGIGDVLMAAMTLYGIPQPGESLGLLSPYNCVEERIPSIDAVNDSGAVVRITCTYRLQRPPEEARLARRGGVSLNQIEIYKDKDGNPLELSHGGETIRTSLNVPVAISHYLTEVIEATDTPEALASEWANHINSEPFRGEPKQTWLCSSVGYEPAGMAATPKRWHFSYEFEHNPDGYVYTTAWEQGDGTIPEDVVEGVGIKDFEHHPERDFVEKFG